MPALERNHLRSTALLLCAITARSSVPVSLRRQLYSHPHWEDVTSPRYIACFGNTQETPDFAGGYFLKAHRVRTLRSSISGFSFCYRCRVTNLHEWPQSFEVGLAFAASLLPKSCGRVSSYLRALCRDYTEMHPLSTIEVRTLAAPEIKAGIH